MKFPNKYIAFDTETTDLDPALGDIIQIGAVILNEDCSIGGEFMTYICPDSEYRNPKAMAVNQISEDIIKGAPDTTRALDDFEAFAFRIGTQPILAAWANYFDVPFLESMYKKIGREYPFSYKSLDLKSIAIWELAKRDLKNNGGVASMAKQLGLDFTGTRHDGLDDIKNSVRILQMVL